LTHRRKLVWSLTLFTEAIPEGFWIPVLADYKREQTKTREMGRQKGDREEERRERERKRERDREREISILFSL
jgi:hypothetical protein